MNIKIMIIIIVSIVAIGFIVALIIPETNVGCTEMGCPCGGISGERPCNSCSISNHIFTTGLINVIQQCRASEIIMCENNVQVNSRIDLENKECETDWYIVGFNLKYLGNNPEETVSNKIN